jgi:BolA protein
MAMDRVQRIESLLRANLAASSVLVEDDSASHAGHAGARSGGGHFNVTVVASCFTDMPTLERHRAVYAAVDEMMPAEIHALAVRALSPEEID